MSSNIINLLWESFLETILMVGVSGGLGAAIGIPLGVFLFVTSPKGIMPKPYVNRIIGTIVNAVRSTPFIILLVAIIPFTRLIVGSSIGTVAAIVPLTIAAAPLIARLVETSLREVDKGLIEAAQSMGATNTQIICKVLLPGSDARHPCRPYDRVCRISRQLRHGRCRWRRRIRRHGYSLRISAFHA